MAANKLLILTQKVDINDDVLGFFHGWISEFAKQYEFVTVICLSAGKYDLPNNVKVLSLGKEVNFQFSIFNFQLMKKIIFTINFYKQISRERNNYNSVFVHMNPEYVILGGWLWKFWNKKIGLWYTHRQVNLKLKIAEKFADVIFTSAPESFQLPSAKVNFMGHGIDLRKFKTIFCHFDTDASGEKSIVSSMSSESDFSPATQNDNTVDIFNIIYVGRISDIKNHKLLIEAINILVNKNDLKNIKVSLIGSTSNEKDEFYLAELKALVKQYDLDNYIIFVGSVPYREIGKYYREADLGLNLCPTGGMDKAVLEAMAVGVPTIVYNKTFSSIFKYFENLLILENPAPAELAEKIKNLTVLDEAKKAELKDYLLKGVEQFSVVNLIKKISTKL